MADVPDSHAFPPGSPGAILLEAREDADQGHFDQALSKHIWFHTQVLAIDRTYYGVRRSYAISFWAELGEVYPPARSALQDFAARDAASIRGGSSDIERFRDFAAISLALGEHEAIADLFIWLDQNDPEMAAEAYERAQGALVRSGHYALCGKYLTLANAVEGTVGRFRRLHESFGRAANPAVGQSFARHRFLDEAALVVALLALNDRPSEADEAAALFLREAPGPDSVEAFERARRGILPDPDA